MIDWEEVIKAESEEELKEIKLWLFQENMRLEQERQRQEQERVELKAIQDSFLKERIRFRDEMDDLNHRTVIERKRLKEENLFFDKKMAILKDGFQQLDADRRKLDQEKRDFALQKDRLLKAQDTRENYDGTEIAQVLFRSAGNPLALRKRYRDLVKIFHPDNLFGDEALVQQINREFFRRRREE